MPRLLRGRLAQAHAGKPSPVCPTFVFFFPQEDSLGCTTVELMLQTKEQPFLR